MKTENESIDKLLIPSQQSHLIYQLDSQTTVTPLTIQLAYDKAKQNNKINQAIFDIFDVIQHLRHLRSDPNKQQNKEKVFLFLDKYQKQTLLTNQLKKQDLKKNILPNLVKFQTTKFYPISKAGALGTIQRKGKFTDKGVLQVESEKQQPKLKEIKSFNSLIQKSNSKTNVSKLEWIKQKKKFPYRIILIDKNNADKAVYFEQEQQAISAQIFLIEKYNLKKSPQNISNLFNKMSQCWQDSYINNFYQQLVKRNQIVKDRIRKQDSIVKKSAQNISMNDFNSKSKIKSEINRTSQAIDRESKGLSQFYFDQKRDSKGNRVYFQDQKKEFNFKKKGRQQNFAQGQSKRLMQISGLRLKRLNDEMIKQLIYQWNDRAIRKGKQQGIRQYAKDGVFGSNKARNEKALIQKQKKYLSFDSIELHFNPAAPCKPHLILEVKSRKQSSSDKNKFHRSLDYTTFFNCNLPNYNNQDHLQVYDLVLNSHFQDHFSTDHRSEQKHEGIYKMQQKHSNKNYNDQQSSRNNQKYRGEKQRRQRMNGSEDWQADERLKSNQESTRNNKFLAIQQAIQQYEVRFKLVNLITEEVLIEKQFNFLNTLCIGSHFTVPIYQGKFPNNLTSSRAPSKSVKDFKSSVRGSILKNSNINSKNHQNYENHQTRQMLHSVDSQKQYDQNENFNNDQSKLLVNISGRYLKVEAKDNLNRNISDNIKAAVNSPAHNLINQKLQIQNKPQSLNQLKPPNQVPPINNLHRLSNFQSNLQNRLHQLPLISSQIKETIHKISIQNIKLQFNNLLVYIPTLQQQKQISPTDQQFDILNKAALILSQFQYIPYSKSYFFILRMLISTNLFQSVVSLLEAFISVILNWSPILLSCNNNNLNLAKIINFQNDQIDKVSEKINIYFQVFQFMLKKETPNLIQKMKRKNIPLTCICFQYSHFLLTKNFQAKLSLNLLLNIFSFGDKSPQILLLLTQIYLCKKLEEQLKKCYQIQQVQDLLQNKIRNSEGINPDAQNQIWASVIILWQRYFSKQKREQYGEQFQIIKNNFYQNQSVLLSEKKQKRFVQKSNLAQRLIQIQSKVKIQVPYYKQKPHCLHIYFTLLPKISGSLYLKTSYSQFQCVNYQRNSYFIIPHLNSGVRLQFIDSKSNQYSFDLIFDKGFGFFKHQVAKQNQKDKIQFQYWAGLFQKSTINQKFKNSKDIEMALSSLLKIQDVKYSLNKQFFESKMVGIIEKICSNKSSSQNLIQELGRKIKTTFSDFQSKLNQYELFLHLIAKMPTALKQKLYILYQFSSAISSELFLCENHSFERVIIYDFLKILQMPISQRQFQALYQETLMNQMGLNSPKIFKARFYYFYENQREIKIQNQIYEYLQQRARKYVYSDIDVLQLLAFLKPTILKSISNLEKQMNRKLLVNQGQLKLVLSSEGQIKHYLFKVTIKNNNRELLIDDEQFADLPYQKELKQAQPKILNMVGIQSDSIVKSFNISPKKMQQIQQSQRVYAALNIPLNQKGIYNSERLLNQKSSFNQASQIKIENSQIERINICRFVLKKYKKIITFRYKKYPRSVQFMNLNFFEDLNILMSKRLQNKELNQIKNVMINKKYIDSMQIFCQKRWDIKFGENQNSELVSYRPQIGIQNNLHLLKQKNPLINTVSFSALLRQFKQQNLAKVLINYGFGVIRWECCQINGFYLLSKDSKKSLSSTKLGRKSIKQSQKCQDLQKVKIDKKKKVFLIVIQGKLKVVNQMYIKCQNIETLPNLGQISSKELQKLQNVDL